MYFSSGHMPEAVIPGMLCSVLVAVLGRSRGQSRTALLPTPWDTQGFIPPHRETRERPERNCQQTKDKSFWRFFQQQQSPLDYPRGTIWPPTSHISSCASPSPPGMSLADQEEVAQGAPAPGVSDLTAHSAEFNFHDCAAMSKWEGILWNCSGSHITLAEVNKKLLLGSTQQCWALRPWVIWY